MGLLRGKSWPIVAKIIWILSENNERGFSSSTTACRRGYGRRWLKRSLSSLIYRQRRSKCTITRTSLTRWVMGRLIVWRWRKNDIGGIFSGSCSTLSTTPQLNLLVSGFILMNSSCYIWLLAAWCINLWFAFIYFTFRGSFGSRISTV